MIDSPAPTAESRAVSVWLVALALACVPAVIVGFGRFAYGVVLPAMKADLGLTFAQMGALNTANALGYLGGALVCAPLTKYVSERQMIIWGVALSVVALWITGLARSFETLLALRALIGITAAFGNIAATGMATRLVGKTDAQSALALGIVIAGPGLGVIFTGLTLPFLLERSSHEWPLAWEFMAIVGAIVSLYIFAMLRHVPPADDLKTVRALARPNFRPLWPAFAAYFLFGLGYIAYMTFLVAYVRKLGASPATVALAWAVLGASMFGASFVWRARLSAERGGTTLFLLGIGGGLSAFLPLLSPSLLVLMISAAGFGVTTMAVYTGVTILLRLHWERPQWTLGVAYATTIFALGQSVGPYGSGLASDVFGPKASLVWSGVILVAAGCVALWQKPSVEIAK